MKTSTPQPSSLSPAAAAFAPVPSPLGEEAVLTVVLRAEANGVELTREAVTPADWTDLFSEVWLNHVLRKGRPGAAFEEIRFRVTPRFKEDSPSRCVSFDVIGALPDGSEARSEFAVRALDAVAARAAERLLQSRLLQADQEYYYEVLAEPAASSGSRDAAAQAFAVIVKSQPLTFLKTPIRPLFEASKAVNLLSEEDPPVFFTAEALARAERCARLGAAQQPPVETGAVLIGSLCACPDSGEFFSVVHDALEVQDAEQTVFSLNYTQKSWTRLQTLMKARQAAWPGRAERILGQCHGHNWLPNDGKTCEACPSRPVCDSTSVFVSRDDQLWSRAVFSRQPWHLCQIFGLTARRDLVSGLFGLRGGRLRERGFFELPEFDLERWSRA
jgi:hypothetical protein